jgi:hypothetical protein
MTLTQKTLSIFSFSLLVALSACNNDDDHVSQPSKDDAKTEISKFNTDAKTDLQDLSGAEGFKAVKDFFDLTSSDDPFGRAAEQNSKHFFRDKGKEFRSVFLTAKAATGRTQGDEPFDFDGNTGVYAWNSQNETFERTADAATIRIQFPTEGSATNDAELKLSAYTEVEVYDEENQEYFYQPETLKADLFVSNEKLAALNLEISWDDYGFPLTADISALAKPFTINVAFDVTNSTTSTLAVALLRDQTALASTQVTATYKDNTKSEESLKKVDGFVQVRNLKLEGTIDVEAANQSQVNWNDIVKLALKADNEKLGDIIIVDENENPVAYLQYADGSKEKLETVLKPVLDEVDALRDDLEVNG